MGDRTYQQTIVWERLTKNYDLITESNRRLDARASLLSTSSSVVIGLVSAAKLLPSRESQDLTIDTVFLVGVCLCGIVIFWLCSKAWMPSEKELPGTTDIDVIKEHYINVDEDEAYEQSIIDLGSCLETAVRVNDEKSQAIDLTVRVFQFELFLLVLAAIL